MFTISPAQYSYNTGSTPCCQVANQDIANLLRNSYNSLEDVDGSLFLSVPRKVQL